MKKNNFQFSIFNFQFLILLLLASCNHKADLPADTPIQTIFLPDSLWEPTGNLRLDSLLEAAAIAPADTNLAMLYNDIGDIYENEDFEKAKEYFLKLGILSEKINWNEGRYLYAVSFSNLLNREGLRDSAMMILHKAYELAVREKNNVWAVNFIFSKGNIYFGNEWYETALTYYMEALPIYESMNDQKKLQQIYYMMSQLYQCINATDKAIEYGEKSLAFNIENESALCALAMAYSNAHQYEKANGYFQEALRICSLANNNYLMGTIYFHLANNALSVFDLTKAEKYVNLSLDISLPFGPVVCCIDYILLSKLEQLKENFTKSEEYIKKALQIATEFDLLEETKLCYTILAELALLKHNYRENIRYWEELDLIEMNIAHNTILSASEEMDAKYETAKNELEIEQQKHIIARQKLQHGLLMVGVVICLITLSLLIYILRLRRFRNSELLEINLTKDKFFNIISHDLKNPAISIKNALQILVNNARSWSPDTLADYHAELLKSAEGNIELLLNLLNWSQIQTGRIIFRPEPFAISELLSSMSLLRKMAENKKITFEVTIPNDVIVTCDSKMLITIIRNLLNNAVKFTESGGTVKLEISPCADLLPKVSNKYIFSIIDTGIGMSDVQLNNLFHLDSANSHSGTAGEEGSGLGLIICKELVEKHGSKLHVESNEGAGSKFWFIV